MKKKYLLLLSALMILSSTGCSKKNNDNSLSLSSTLNSEITSSEEIIKKEDVTIVYTNDVHSYIANTVKNEDGTTSDGLRLSKIKAYVDDLKKEGKNVILADDGDEIQGNVYGSCDNGKSIIDIMNAAGYDIATPGNHEFDYGMDTFNDVTKQANYPYVSCNFISTDDNSTVLEPYNVIECGNVKVAFVGISTPETLTSSTPKNFQDDKGNFIYTFAGLNNPENLYSTVQKAIDAARKEADYVVALGHTGVGLDEEKSKIRSIDIINNTTGLDAYIDGHSHTTMEHELVKDKSGKEIPLTQTGYYLNAFGVMNITSNGEITTELKTDYTRSDETVAELENNLIKKVNDMYGQEIGVLDSTLYIMNPENENQRIIRARETNAGDFVADSVYWYFNEYQGLDCDVAIVNGGGIRAQTAAGTLTYQSAKTIESFGNVICLIEATGQQIKDALEMGLTEVADWDDKWNMPSENGGFLHVAGIKFDADCSIPTSVKKDENNMFEKVDGEYRVRNMQVYDKTAKKYVDMDMNKTYRLGGINYLLRNSGNGLNMFVNDNVVVDYLDLDYKVLADYIQAFAKGEDNMPHVNSLNSPLSDYTDYALNYENAFGAGRINLMNLPSSYTI